MDTKRHHFFEGGSGEAFVPFQQASAMTNTEPIKKAGAGPGLFTTQQILCSNALEGIHLQYQFIRETLQFSSSHLYFIRYS